MSELINYFHFYRIPVSFKINSNHLRDLFFEREKLYRSNLLKAVHSEDTTKYLDLSEINSRAYSTLINKDARMRHILDLYPIEGCGLNDDVPEYIARQYQLSQMDSLGLQKKISDMLDNLESNQWPNVAEINPEKMDLDKRQIVLDYYWRRKYLLWFQKSLDNFDA